MTNCKNEIFIQLVIDVNSFHLNQLNINKNNVNKMYSYLRLRVDEDRLVNMYLYRYINIPVNVCVKKSCFTLKNVHILHSNQRFSEGKI